MDYEKKFPITQQPGDFVLAQWERGYKHLELTYKDRLIGTVSGAAKIRKGHVIQDEQLGNIELRFSERPMGLDLIIDGFHSQVNGSHPAKELKRTATFFWIIAVFALIFSGMESMGAFYLNVGIFFFVCSINLLVTVAYFIAAIFVGKSKPWAYYFGLSVFTVMLLLTLFNAVVIGTGTYGLIGIVIRLIVFGVLLYNLKTVIATQKHARFGKAQPITENLLDRE